MSTGAIITGRRTGEFADYWGGDHHDGVPIFVPTHIAPTDNRYERVHFRDPGHRGVRGAGHDQIEDQCALQLISARRTKRPGV